MKKLLVSLIVAAFALATSSVSHAASANDAVVEAATTFLSTLTAEQRKQVVFAFDDATQRARWSNFPTGVVRRAGISLKQMNPAQREAATRLLATVLSPAGLRKVDDIRAADDDFKANGSKRGPPGGRGGPPPGGPGPGKPMSGDDLFGSDLYFISFLGQPSATRPWMLQFGGHHLALNITVSGKTDLLTPTLTGAQPAVFELNGKTVRPLAGESDKAVTLLKSLDDAQRRQAVLGYRVADLVLGPGEDGKTIAPDGLKVSAMTPAQRALLLDVVGEWAGIVNDAAAKARMARIASELDDTWFAWSGPTDASVGTNITAYYRIQGPHLVIEYAPQSDEPGNHVHTIYRDPTDDYGRTSVRR